MLIFPAIDLYDGRAVRLLRGDYEKMTVYSDDPVSVAKSFADAGASQLHIVDLAGARYGGTANSGMIERIVSQSGLSAEVGGGIRGEAVIRHYLGIGVRRVILGTAAVMKPGFAAEMAAKYGDRIAAGVDIKDGFAAIKGWTELSRRGAGLFCREMREAGVRTIICTDISKDGALKGTNLELYGRLSSELDVNLIASGGVSTLGDVAALSKLGIYGAILGKALYTGDISLREAIAAAERRP